MGRGGGSSSRGGGRPGGGARTLASCVPRAMVLPAGHRAPVAAWLACSHTDQKGATGAQVASGGADRRWRGGRRTGTRLREPAPSDSRRTPWTAKNSVAAFSQNNRMTDCISASAPVIGTDESSASAPISLQCVMRLSTKVFFAIKLELNFNS